MTDSATLMIVNTGNLFYSCGINNVTTVGLEVTVPALPGCGYHQFWYSDTGYLWLMFSRVVCKLLNVAAVQSNVAALPLLRCLKRTAVTNSRWKHQVHVTVVLMILCFASCSVQWFGRVGHAGEIWWQRHYGKLLRYPLKKSIWILLALVLMSLTLQQLIPVSQLCLCLYRSPSCLVMLLSCSFQLCSLLLRSFHVSFTCVALTFVSHCWQVKENALSRQSLYVKFDPLVKGPASPGTYFIMLLLDHW